MKSLVGRTRVDAMSASFRSEIRVLVNRFSCTATIMESGSAQAIPTGEWMLESPQEFGEPYMLLPAGTEVKFIGLRPN